MCEDSDNIVFLYLWHRLTVAPKCDRLQSRQNRLFFICMQSAMRDEYALTVIVCSHLNRIRDNVRSTGGETSTVIIRGPPYDRGCITNCTTSVCLSVCPSCHSESREML